MSRYLYCRPNHRDDVFRSEVTRETEKNLWIMWHNKELRIAKGHCLKIGSGYDMTILYEETPEWKEEYEKSYQSRKFRAHLRELEKCTDPEIMDKVLAVEIPKK